MVANKENSFILWVTLHTTDLRGPWMDRVGQAVSVCAAESHNAVVCAVLFSCCLGQISSSVPLWSIHWWAVVAFADSALRNSSAPAY